MEARYTPGQVWVPAGVPRQDANPRPHSPLVPLGLLAWPALVLLAGLGLSVGAWAVVSQELRQSQEARFARTRDRFGIAVLLDLHSMHDDGVPLMLAGPLDKGIALAKRVGTPVDIIADAGHAAGMRMRDYGGFGDPKSSKNALLIETGQHWRASSVVVAKDVTARFLAETGVVEPGDLPAGWKQPPTAPQRVVRVTHAVATKRGNFRPARRFEGQEIIAKNNFRPRDTAVLKKNAARFANIKLFTVDQSLGGWAKVSKTHFADGGTYDQVMAGIKR